MDILLGVYNIKPTKTKLNFDVNDRVRLSAYAYNFKKKKLKQIGLQKYLILKKFLNLM